MATDLKKMIPREPEQSYELNIDAEIINNLVLKELYVHGKKTPRQMGKSLKIKQEIIQKIVNDLKGQELAGMVGGSGMGTDYQYGLYPKGTQRAKEIMDRDAYIGPAPVGWDDYVRVTQQVMAENKKSFKINRELLQAKFAHHLGYKDILMQIGQAVCARKPAFVFGFPGNGKTFLCSAVVKLLPPMLVPYAIEVGSQLVRVFDPSCHEVIEDIDLDGLDERWIPVKPPMITAGGELTLDDLEVKFNKKYGCFDAPPQVKANGGVFLIDDLGRQRCEVEEIFNRFIIPLENKVDYLVLGGQRMQVLCDEIMLFSTNLDPMKIVDDAFLRRLPYKINVRNPHVEEYTAIWKAMCEKLGLVFLQSNVDHIVERYKKDRRGLRAVHPRDVLTIIRDQKKFMEIESLNISNEEIDEAYGIYFVTEMTLVESFD